MLDAVQQRNHRLGSGLDTFERVLERGRLHRDEQELDALAQLRRCLGPRRLDFFAVHQGQTLGPDEIGRVRACDTDDPDTCAHQADREHAADRTGSENRNRHVFAGSEMRLTYFQSV